MPSSLLFQEASSGRSPTLGDTHESPSHDLCMELREPRRQVPGATILEAMAMFEFVLCPSVHSNVLARTALPGERGEVSVMFFFRLGYFSSSRLVHRVKTTEILRRGVPGDMISE